MGHTEKPLLRTGRAAIWLGAVVPIWGSGPGPTNPSPKLGVLDSDASIIHEASSYLDSSAQANKSPLPIPSPYMPLHPSTPQRSLIIYCSKCVGLSVREHSIR